MKTLTLSLIVLFLTACTASPTKTAPQVATTTESTQVATPAKEIPAQAAKNCICVKMWMPVCGKNNKTYGNSCEADCAGVKYTQGACAAKK